MSTFKKTLKEEHVTNRTFSYSKGSVTLKFTLRIDIKSELNDFIELLQKALKDVEDESDKKL